MLFAFDMYDEDGSGTISTSEVGQILKDVYGEKNAGENAMARKILARLKSRDSAVDSTNLTVPEFADFCRRHPGLLFPAFSFQTELRKQIVGPKFWSTLLQRRFE